MTLSSSPLQYPATSSPRESSSPRKRRRLDYAEDREALKPLANNSVPLPKPSTFGGFLVDDDSDEEHSPIHEARKAHAEQLEDTILSIDEIEKEQRTKPRSTHGVDSKHDSGCELLSSPTLPPQSSTSKFHCLPTTRTTACTSTGQSHSLPPRRQAKNTHYSALAAARSTTVAGRAQKDYYGIEIHALLDQSNALLEAPVPAAPPAEPIQTIEISTDSTRTLLWTEKYRARKFTDLLGDERTHRSVLRWLKSWDPVVFPSAHVLAKPKARNPLQRENAETDGNVQRRKILLLTGPPGLGKTTLAHVCARQAGYEPHEINASDDRTREVVKNKIRDMVGTENVKAVNTPSAGSKKAKPVCVIVDEVDGVTSGANAGGDGGFVKALTDLLALDAKNAYKLHGAGKKKGDSFRLLRPIVLICNDVYAPALRLLRTGSFAEVIHVRRPAMQSVVPRLCSIFEREGVPADGDGVRALCEAAWGVVSRKAGGGKNTAGNGNGEGDIRGILVAGEWVAGKLRDASLTRTSSGERLTRKWMNDHVLSELTHGGSMAKSLGRGSARDIVERVFKHGAGFPATPTAPPSGIKRRPDNSYTTPVSATEATKKTTLARLRETVEASGDEEKITQELFATWPTRPVQDTTTLTKPNEAAEWLHFSNLCSHRLHSAQEWDLAPYLSFPVLGFHALFASSANAIPTNAEKQDEEVEKHPLHSHRADAHAVEVGRANSAHLTQLHTQLPLPLQRSFRSHASLATELIPYVLRILNPAVKPSTVAGVSSVRRGEERELVDRAVNCMRATGMRLEKGRVDFSEDGAGDRAGTNGGWVYRMEPPMDELGSYGTSEGRGEGDAGRARYALRQVLANSYDVEVKKVEAAARQKRSGLANPTMNTEDVGGGKEKQAKEVEQARKKGKEAVKRDFFGRPIVAATASGDAVAVTGRERDAKVGGKGRPSVWVTYSEGFSNAVRKGITWGELMDGL